jgi:hypothetical protein
VIATLAAIFDLSMEKNSVTLGATATTFTIPNATLATAGTYDVLISGP